MAKHDDTRNKPKLSNQTHPERSATVATILEKKTHYPWIRLRGHWLQKAGFSPETKVRIRVMTDCLVITKD